MKKRRTLKPEFKFQVAIESIREEKSRTEIAREYNVHPQLATDWRRQLILKGPKIFTNDRKEEKKDKKAEELEKIIGRQTIEIQFLKKVLGHLD